MQFAVFFRILLGMTFTPWALVTLLGLLYLPWGKLEGLLTGFEYSLQWNMIPIERIKLALLMAWNWTPQTSSGYGSGVVLITSLYQIIQTYRGKETITKRYWRDIYAKRLEHATKQFATMTSVFFLTKLVITIPFAIAAYFVYKQQLKHRKELQKEESSTTNIKVFIPAFLSTCGVIAASRAPEHHKVKSFFKEFKNDMWLAGAVTMIATAIKAYEQDKLANLNPEVTKDTTAKRFEEQIAFLKGEDMKTVPPPDYQDTKAKGYVQYKLDHPGTTITMQEYLDITKDYKNKSWLPPQVKTLKQKVQEVRTDYSQRTTIKQRSEWRRPLMDTIEDHCAVCKKKSSGDNLLVYQIYVRSVFDGEVIEHSSGPCGGYEAFLDKLTSLIGKVEIKEAHDPLNKDHYSWFRKFKSNFKESMEDFEIPENDPQPKPSEPKDWKFKNFLHGSKSQLFQFVTSNYNKVLESVTNLLVFVKIYCESNPLYKKLKGKYDKMTQDEKEIVLTIFAAVFLAVLYKKFTSYMKPKSETKGKQSTIRGNHYVHNSVNTNKRNKQTKTYNPVGGTSSSEDEDDDRQYRHSHPEEDDEYYNIYGPMVKELYDMAMTDEDIRAYGKISYGIDTDIEKYDIMGYIKDNQHLQTDSRGRFNKTYGEYLDNLKSHFKKDYIKYIEDENDYVIKKFRGESEVLITNMDLLKACKQIRLLRIKLTNRQRVANHLQPYRVEATNIDEQVKKILNDYHKDLKIQMDKLQFDLAQVQKLQIASGDNTTAVQKTLILQLKGLEQEISNKLNDFNTEKHTLVQLKDTILTEMSKKFDDLKNTTVIQKAKQTVNTVAKKIVEKTESNTDVEARLPNIQIVPTTWDKVQAALKQYKELTGKKFPFIAVPKTQKNKDRYLLQQVQNAIKAYAPPTQKYEAINEAIIQNTPQLKMKDFENQVSILTEDGDHLKSATAVSNVLVTCAHPEPCYVGQMVKVAKVVDDVIVAVATVKVIHVDTTKDLSYLEKPVFKDRILDDGTIKPVTLQSKRPALILDQKVAVICGSPQGGHEYKLSVGPINVDGRHKISTVNGFSGAGVLNESGTSIFGVHLGTAGGDVNKAYIFTEEDIRHIKTFQSKN